MVTVPPVAVAAAPKRKRYHAAITLSLLVGLSFAVNDAHSFSLKSRIAAPIAFASSSPARHHSHCRRRLDANVSISNRYMNQLHQSQSSSIEDGGNNDSNTISSQHNLAKLDLSVAAVLLASFLNLLGFTMASPIQPALGKHFSLPIGASFGSLSSAYPLGMLLGVFLWPSLSDVLGRKIVMVLTLAGSGMGLLLQSWGIRQCWTLEHFLMARVATGCFAGNSPISKAYLADIGSVGNTGNLAKYLAWKDAASTLAFIVGPVLGGFIYSLFGGALGNNSNQISFVIFCSAMASLIASVSLMILMKSHVENANTPDTKQTPTPFAVDVNDTKSNSESKSPKAEIVSCPLGTRLWTGVATVACVSALYHAADSTFFAFFPSLLANKLGFDPQAVGMAFTGFAFVSFSMSAFVSSRFVKLFGPVASCATGLAAVGTGLMALGHSASLPASVGFRVLAALILGASALYYTGVPLYGPSVPTMLLQCVPSHRRGRVMGIDGAVNTLARVVSPLIIGEIHRVKGAGACFKVAGSCAYAAISVVLFRRWVVMRKLFEKAEAQ